MPKPKGRHVPRSTSAPRPGEIARAKGRTLNSYRIGALPIVDRILQLTFRTSALDYPRISFGAKLRGAVRYRRSSARWLDAVTERQLP